MFQLYHISAIIRCYKNKETRYTELKVFSKIHRIKVLYKILSSKYPIRIYSVIYKLKLTARRNIWPDVRNVNTTTTTITFWFPTKQTILTREESDGSTSPSCSIHSSVSTPTYFEDNTCSPRRFQHPGWQHVLGHSTYYYGLHYQPPWTTILLHQEASYTSCNTNWRTT
jgi:hypothetical protein